MLILVSIEYIKWMHEVDLSTRSDQRNRSRIAATICNCDGISRAARMSKSNHWVFSDWRCHRSQMLQLKFGQFSLEENLAALETFPPFFSFSDPKRITIHFKRFQNDPPSSSPSSGNVGLERVQIFRALAGFEPWEIWASFRHEPTQPSKSTFSPF